MTYEPGEIYVAMFESRNLGFAQGRCSIRFLIPFWRIFEMFSESGRKMREAIRTVNKVKVSTIFIPLIFLLADNPILPRKKPSLHTM